MVHSNRKLLRHALAILTATLAFGCGSTSYDPVATNNNFTNVNNAQNAQASTESVEPLIQAGLRALSPGAPADIIAARELFALAVSKLSSDSPQSEKDRANFFLALTRVQGLANELKSDGNPSNFDSVADFLDGLGYLTTSGGQDARTTLNRLVRPTTFRSGVTGANARAFLNGRAKAELEAAISNLNSVSPQLGSPLTYKVGNLTRTAEVDFGDVLALRAAIRGLLGHILVLAGYDLGGDIGNQLNSPLTVQALLASNSNLLNQSSAANLATAREAYRSGLADVLSALDFIQGETDSQSNDLIGLGNIRAGELTKFRQQVAAAQQALNNSATTRSASGSTATLNLPSYFTNGQSLRPFAPSFTGNRATTLFPGSPFSPTYSPTTAGSPSDPNHDFNFNGVPDLLE